MKNISGSRKRRRIFDCINQIEVMQPVRAFCFTFFCPSWMRKKKVIKIVLASKLMELWIMANLEVHSDDDDEKDETEGNEGNDDVCHSKLFFASIHFICVRQMVTHFSLHACWLFARIKHTYTELHSARVTMCFHFNKIKMNSKFLPSSPPSSSPSPFFSTFPMWKNQQKPIYLKLNWKQRSIPYIARSPSYTHSPCMQCYSCTRPFSVISVHRVPLCV